MGDKRTTIALRPSALKLLQDYQESIKPLGKRRSLAELISDAVEAHFGFLEEPDGSLSVARYQMERRARRA